MGISNYAGRESYALGREDLHLAPGEGAVPFDAVFSAIHFPKEPDFAPPYHPYTETLLAAVPEPVPSARAQLLAKDVQEAEPPARGCCFQRRCPRRIGSICDDETPSSQIAATGHVIRCHIPLEELRKSQVDLISTADIPTHGIVTDGQ